MALVVNNRIQETTATTGTGTITLGGAVAGFQSFAVIGNGNTTYYCIVNGTAWEVGIGTYTASGTTLTRTTVLSNSNGNTSPITLAGSSNVFVTYPSEKSVNQDASTGTAFAPAFNASNGLLLNSTTVASNYTVPAGSNAISIGPMVINSGVVVTVTSGQRWVVI